MKPKTLAALIATEIQRLFSVQQQLLGQDERHLHGRRELSGRETDATHRGKKARIITIIIFSPHREAAGVLLQSQHCVMG